mmetsp:Transcript_4349/g.7640  ORF Transcript_4349/g.7640 Transcript_4349/m.7640 type:complete len:183 (+) Transcript_4349:204-752(+)
MASSSALHDLVDFFAELEALATKYKTILYNRQNLVVDGGEMLEKMDFKKKRRITRDPNAPKRPMTAYLCFSLDAREKLKKEHPEFKNTQVMQAIGNMWERVNDEEREKYLERSRKLKQKYEREKMEYDRKVATGELPKPPSGAEAKYLRNAQEAELESLMRHEDRGDEDEDEHKMRKHRRKA